VRDRCRARQPRAGSIVRTADRTDGGAVRPAGSARGPGPDFLRPAIARIVRIAARQSSTGPSGPPAARTRCAERSPRGHHGPSGVRASSEPPYLPPRASDPRRAGCSSSASDHRTARGRSSVAKVRRRISSGRGAAPTASRPLSVEGARTWRRRWDRSQSADVRDREGRFSAMLLALEASVGPRFRFLDLGTGTGSLSARITRRFPRSSGWGLDFDPVLLKLARTGLPELRSRMRWIEADLRGPDWAATLPTGPLDAVVSTTALHWLTPPQLTRLYRVVGRRLRPGGIFLNGDSLAYPGSEPRLAEIARVVRERSGETSPRGEPWTVWWSSIRRDPRFAAEFIVRDRRYPREHAGTPTPDLAGHIRRIRSSGFREVDVLWSQGSSRVLAAVR